jgi:hypothetical protein
MRVVLVAIGSVAVGAVGDPDGLTIAAAPQPARSATVIVQTIPASNFLTTSGPFVVEQSCLNHILILQKPSLYVDRL